MDKKRIMKDITVIYYTSNRESEDFEAKIRNNLKNTIGNLPLISVSHKPIDFGQNICVGDVGTSDHNIYRQMQLALMKVRTKFVATTEADCLYPPSGYFDFEPPDETTAYHYLNVWIMHKGYPIYRKKAFSLCALFSNAEYLANRIDQTIGYLPMWSEKKPHPLFHKYRGWTPFTNRFPVLNIKTKEGMRWHTGTEKITKKSLPYFGDASKLQEKLWPNQQKTI